MQIMSSFLPLVDESISHSTGFVAFCRVSVDLKEIQGWVSYRASSLQVIMNLSTAFSTILPIYELFMILKQERPIRG
jgi:hypothetical protein